MDGFVTALHTHRSTSPTADAITPRNPSNREVFGGAQPIPEAERKRVLADIAASPSSLLAASRPPRLAAIGNCVGFSSAEIVAPLRSIDVSHLMARLDRKRVQA